MVSKAPRFSWTRIKGESNVQGGGKNGSVEERGKGRGSASRADVREPGGRLEVVRADVEGGEVWRGAMAGLGLKDSNGRPRVGASVDHASRKRDVIRIAAYLRVANCYGGDRARSARPRRIHGGDLEAVRPRGRRERAMTWRLEKLGYQTPIKGSDSVDGRRPRGRLALRGTATASRVTTIQTTCDLDPVQADLGIRGLDPICHS